jgi:hypothetical protein
MPRHNFVANNLHFGSRTRQRLAMESESPMYRVW